MNIDSVGEGSSGAGVLRLSCSASRAVVTFSAMETEEVCHCSVRAVEAGWAQLNTVK